MWSTKRYIGTSILMAALMSGCAAPQIRPTASITASNSAKEVALMLEHQANACWARDRSPFHDGIAIDGRLAIDGAYVISAARFANDIGLQDPFFVVTIKDSAIGRSVVSTNEAAYACSIAGGCYTLEYTQDVKRWLDGDQTCVEKKEPWF